jgi:acetyltransferase-like isoleucine patch superfamily enzyme
MPIIDYLKKVTRFALKKTLHFIFQHPRIFKYKLLSNCNQVIGKPRLNQPLQINGKGKVVFHQNVRFGVDPSPFLYSGYCYVDSRNKSSKIEIGKDCWINNNFIAIAEGEGIEIGPNTLIGPSCEIFDSDFHELQPDKRKGGVAKTAKVKIGENVFIGSNVKILKGVLIGKNSVIANGSVVTKSIPENVIAAGVPAKVIRAL